MTESRWVGERLGRPVVKAFNNIQAQHLMELEARGDARPHRAAGGRGRCRGQGGRDGLVDELGFDPVDAGGIDKSWRQQPGTPVYAADLDAAGVGEALRQAGPERRPRVPRLRPPPAARRRVDPGRRPW